MVLGLLKAALTFSAPSSYLYLRISEALQQLVEPAVA